MRQIIARLRRSPNFGRWLGGIFLAAVLAAIISLVGITKLEENNQFCGSCHTEPETMYLARFESSVATGFADDLAAYHYRQRYPRDSVHAENIGCSECHVGEGILGRSIVLSLAAWDAAKYFTRSARQPAQVVFTIQNEACIKCHEQQVKVNLDKPKHPFIIDNHFHYKLFERDAPFERCVDCHLSHEEGVEATKFQFRRAIIPVCEDCHRQEGRGPVNMPQ